jgi:hypothetical protein
LLGRNSGDDLSFPATGEIQNGINPDAVVDTSNANRHCDVPRQRLQTDRKLAYAKSKAESLYLANIAKSHL